MDPSLLIDDDLAGFLSAMISRSPIYSGSLTVGYYIELDDNASVTLAGTNADVVASEYEQSIVDIFTSLDPYIDIDFERCYDADDALIKIYQVVGLEGSNGLGFARARNGYMQVVYEASGNEEDDLFLITHEIGHSVGLGHPDGDGDNDRWDRADTIMSYNYDPNTDFTQADLEALISIWGNEISAESINRFRGSDLSDEILANSQESFIDYIEGLDGDDILYGYQGSDTVIGGDSDDEVRGGNGADYLSGGDGKDIIYGGFGRNIFADERDFDADTIFLKSDQFAFNPVLGSTGNNSEQQRVDTIESLDSSDRIIIQGVSTDQISINTAQWLEAETLVLYTGLGIYADGYLEAIYLGENLTNTELSQMVSGDL